MSVWDDIADTREEVKNLKVRAALISGFRSQVNEIGRCIALYPKGNTL